MTLPSAWQDPLFSFWCGLDELFTSISRNVAVNVNSIELRDQTRSVVQSWFRIVRPYLIGMGMAEETLVESDVQAQRLLTLAAGRNSKASYLMALRAFRRERPRVEGNAELLRGAVAAPDTVRIQLSNVESAVLTTLERMLPDGALSYRQVVQDLAGPPRYSYRGTATELREVVREVLDYLAPDAEVMNASGFKLEKDRKAPTMKQKARYILRARGLGDTTRKAPEDAVELLEEQIASLARSVYERGSASTHSATRVEAVRNFKGYADAILAELLAVHSSKPETAS